VTWRIGLCVAWACLAPGAAGADAEFIPLPVPPTGAPAQPVPPVDRGAEIDRAVRGVRQRVEERELEQGGSRAELEAYRARERRALELESRRTPPGDAERVRADVERARERLELERRIERAEELRARGATRATPDHPR
jgi:hypothetical protein